MDILTVLNTHSIRKSVIHRWKKGLTFSNRLTLYIIILYIVKMAAARPTFLTMTSQDVYSVEVKTSHNELESLQQAIKDNLNDVSVYFARILKHAARAKVDMSNAGEDWRDHYLETLQTDIEKLRRLSYELDLVHTTHPYCAGCNDPAGFQPNQMAHTCGHEDSDSDEEEC